MSLAMNPVLGRELTERMRGPRAMIMLSIYLTALGAIVLLVYKVQVSNDQSGFGDSPVTQLAGVGQGLFEWTLLFVLLLVLFLVPGFTAGSIAGERERQTLLPMQVSMLRPIDIVLGKIGASVMYTLLLVVATLPLLTVAYLVGGIRVGEVFKGLSIVLFTAVVVAALSVACSAFMKRVQTSTVLAYAMVLMLLGGTVVAYFVADQVDRSRGTDRVDPPAYILSANPLAALADLAGDDPYERQLQANFGGFDIGGSYNSPAGSPLSEIRRELTPDLFFDGNVPFDNFGRPVLNDADLPDPPTVPLWLTYIGVMSALTLISVAASVRRLRAPAESER